MREKVYNIGFTAGTFDLFHIGHLNLLKRAKINCDKLIVGVNSDDLVLKYKNKMPVIPVQDRMEILAHLNMVDKVVKMDNLDKLDAHRKYGFDVVFIGDDWKNSPRWNKTEEELAMIGVSVIYLPYTSGISSTQIVNKINKKDEINAC